MVNKCRLHEQRKHQCLSQYRYAILNIHFHRIHHFNLFLQHTTIFNPNNNVQSYPNSLEHDLDYLRPKEKSWKINWTGGFCALKWRIWVGGAEACENIWCWCSQEQSWDAVTAVECGQSKHLQYFMNIMKLNHVWDPIVYHINDLLIIGTTLHNINLGLIFKIWIVRQLQSDKSNLVRPYTDFRLN